MKKLKKRIIFIILSLFLVIISLSVFLFLTKFKGTKGNGELVSRVSRFDMARDSDENIVGWIKINGTNIDYPVRLGNDLSSNHSEDIIWINDTLGNGRNRKVIFGHNILNVSSKPLIDSKRLTRFEPLMAYVYQDFTKEHLYIQYSDIDSKESLYKIYAVSFYETEDDNGESYLSKEEITNYINVVKEKSIYDFSVDVNADDSLITLATCTRFFGVNGPTHFKVDARKVRKNEKCENYSVKKTSNYVIINEE